MMSVNILNFQYFNKWYGRDKGDALLAELGKYFQQLCHDHDMIAGYMGSVPLMLACTAIAAIGMSPLQGDMNALIATCSEYTYLTSGKRVDGTMYSCTSLGTKLGGGIGTALAGWLLALSGYVGKAEEQSASTLNMLHIMYLWMPMIFNLLITLILTRLNVEQANEELRAQKA